jgi:endonuclease/exonuclease/phosphatase (EEP) superfamily protein YafD
MAESPAQLDRKQPAAVRRRLALAIWAAWIVAVAVTALGFLAPLVPAFDVINNLRIALAIFTVLLLAGAFFARDWRLLRPTAALVLVQAGFLLLPMARAGEHDAGRTPTLRLLTFNVHVGNDRFDEIADYVLSSDADAVALQELSCAAADKLIPKFKRHYPHAFVSPGNCFGIALLAKRPLLTTGQVVVAPRQRPLLVWARLDWGGTPMGVTTAHLIPPLAPNDQASQVSRLITHVASLKGGAQIVAGDFNLTPFSWSFARLNNAGLGHHVSYRATWTPIWAADWLPPVLTIDNVLTTRNVAAMRVMIGPALGSDHRPVIADLALTK